ncbi:MAG: MSEP-CTERM sorting domain-containing protein, partial [Bacteroidota bacterium]
MCPETSFKNHLHKSRGERLTKSFILGVFVFICLCLSTVMETKLLDLSNQTWLIIIGLYLLYGGFLFSQHVLMKRNNKEQWKALLNGICVATAIPMALWIIQLNFDTQIEILNTPEPALCMALTILPITVYQLFQLSKISLFQWKISSWIDALGMVGIPVLIYATVTLVIPGLRNPYEKFMLHSLVVMVGIGLLLVLFFLFRLFSNRTDQTKKGIRTGVKALIVLVFPILGLYFNQEMGIGHDSGLFGNWSDPGWYIIAIITGLLLLTPSPSLPKARLILLIAKMLVLPYSLYFCIVFLPLTPVGLIAIISLGLGLLMLTPFALLYFHIVSIQQDIKALSFHYLKPVLYSLYVLATVIPFTYYILQIQIPKNRVQRFLSHIHTPEYLDNDGLDFQPEEVESFLNSLRRHNDDWFFTGTPIITHFYKEQVLNGLTISRDNQSKIRSIYLGDRWNRQSSNRANSRPSSAKITNLKTETVTLASGIHETQVHIEVANKNEINRLGE